MMIPMKMNRSVHITEMHDTTKETNERLYWLSRTPEERFAAVEFLRRQMYDPYPERLQRVLTVITRA
jgi:hypothetical protein